MNVKSFKVLRFVIVALVAGFVGGLLLMKSYKSGSMPKFGEVKTVGIVLGSTREGRSSDKIGAYIEKILLERNDITVKMLDLRDFNLPFLHDAIAPVNQKEITDHAVKKWAEAVEKTDAFIIVVPLYNASYPGVLKNALDLLYKEWNGKPVGFVAYSGGATGGANAIAHLRDVVKELQMIPVHAQVKIPYSWKAFDLQGKLLDPTTQKTVNTMIDQILNK